MMLFILVLGFLNLAGSRSAHAACEYLGKEREVITGALGGRSSSAKVLGARIVTLNCVGVELSDALGPGDDEKLKRTLRALQVALIEIEPIAGKHLIFKLGSAGGSETTAVDCGGGRPGTPCIAISYSKETDAKALKAQLLALEFNGTPLFKERLFKGMFEKLLLAVASVSGNQTRDSNYLFGQVDTPFPEDKEVLENLIRDIGSNAPVTREADPGNAPADPQDSDQVR